MKRKPTARRKEAEQLRDKIYELKMLVKSNELTISNLSREKEILLRERETIMRDLTDMTQSLNDAKVKIEVLEADVERLTQGHAKLDERLEISRDSLDAAMIVVVEMGRRWPTTGS